MTDSEMVGVDVLARLKQLPKTARMWGSPGELEAVARAFTHLALRARDADWTPEASEAWWRDLGGPFAGDAEEHAAMRERLYGNETPVAYGQVVMGFVVVWAAVARRADREALLAPHIEGLLDAPESAGSPEGLNAALFALMGFAAADALGFVGLLEAERQRVGGHALRPLHVVAPPGPSEASLQYARRFESWEAVVQGLERAAKKLESA